MTFLAPLALGFGLALPIVVLLYLLKVRRIEREVSSTLLWEMLRRDLAAHEPWQRLRWSILLALQLLLLGVLTLALARPSVQTPAPASGFAAIIIDTSASMRATDVLPSRFEQAVEAAQTVIAALPDATSGAIIEAGATAQVVVPETSDHAALLRGLAGLHPSDAPGDAVDAALRIAGALARGRSDATIHLFSDGAYDHPPAWDELTNVHLRFHPVGTVAGNQAITGLAARPGVDGLAAVAAGPDARQLFARLQNFDSRPTQVTVTLSADGQTIETRPVDLPADGARQLFFTDVPPEARVIRLQIDPSDALLSDNQAALIRATQPTTPVLLVTRGNVFLQKVLQAIPGLALYQVAPRSFPTVDVTPYSVLIFDGYVPDQPPTKNALIIDPTDAPWLPLEGIVRAPPITLWRNDDPTLAYVDLRPVRIARASNVKLPDWAHPLIESNRVPLAFIGDNQGRRIVGLTFDLRQSNLPLSASFPVLMANVMRFLTPATATQAASLAPGTPALIQPRPGVDRVVIVGPGQQQWTITPSDQVLRFPDTDRVGLYQVTEYVGTQAVGTHQFAVNLFDPAESDLRPRATLLDRDPLATASAKMMPIAHEYAPWLLLLAVPLMLGEWWWYHRRS